MERKKHPLIGTGVHWCEPDGYVQNQAVIIDVIPSNGQAGDLALLQYYEWLMGHPSTRRLVPLAELASSEQWTLYASAEEMNDH